MLPTPNSPLQPGSEYQNDDSSTVNNPPSLHGDSTNDAAYHENGRHMDLGNSLRHSELMLLKTSSHPSNVIGSSPTSRPDVTDSDSEIVQLHGGGNINGREGKKDALAETSAMSRPGMGAGPGVEKRAKEVTIAQGAPDIIDSESIINQYRQRMARDVERREMSGRRRISPIWEETPKSPSPTSTSTPRQDTRSAGYSDLRTVSTESNKTPRGGIIPSSTPGMSARTPSYPFPRMTTPNHAPTALQGVFSNHSQGSVLNWTGVRLDNPVTHDQVRSDPSTPASAMTFQPSGAPQVVDNFDYPNPNVYELALMLTAEPGLDAWFSTVIQIMRDCYKADRVTLSIPSDPTDLENVPWGQKATYNVLEDDEFSMGYLARDGSGIPSNFDDLSDLSSNFDSPQMNQAPARPAILSRHSFTSYERQKESHRGHLEEISTPQRPGPMLRSKSYFPLPETHTPSSPHPALNEATLEEHDAVEERQSSWDGPLTTGREFKGRVLSGLQALDFEADPLIDHNGVKRVIERGKVIALTRSYPYLDPPPENPPDGATTVAREESKRSKKVTRIDSGTKIASFCGSSSRHRNKLSGDKSQIANMMSLFEEDPRPPSPKFEEYEQAPPSPWSQSPAPSPAVRSEPKENPFFTNASVDEDSFNPGPSPQDYTNLQPPETIGVDNSWTVLHIPLKHILLSRPMPVFKLNPEVLAQKSSAHGRTDISKEKAESTKVSGRASSPDSQTKSRQSPIAILSILTPVIPYPSNLRHSLEYLAPHLATSFSLSRHYSNLETEVAGLQRKRPATTGFGGLGPDGRPLADPMMFAQLNEMPLDNNSLTSPSDFSGPTRSVVGSPVGTPGWDSGPLGSVLDRRAKGISPGQSSGDSYFTAVPKTGYSTTDSGPTTPWNRSGLYKDTSIPTERKHRRSESGKHVRQDNTTNIEPGDHDLSHVASEKATDAITPATIARKFVEVNDLTGQPIIDDAPATSKDIGELRDHRTELRTAGQGDRRHTKLHTYGADFATTNPLLPSGGILPNPTAHASTPTQTTLLVPGLTERLKTLMIDSLPAHVFLAIPPTGEVVWVNSRYLSYRGQNLDELALDPWGSIHAEERDQYLKKWTHSLRTGEQFAETVRLRRFDGTYRWFQARAAPQRDKRGVIVHFIGSYMDIHDQKVAELIATRQEEILVSESKHRTLANSIPQIIFAATEADGILFANQQWLSYTGQSFEDTQGLGFMQFVHPDDLAKCRIPCPERPAGLAAETFQTSGTSTPTKQTNSPSNTSKGQSVSSSSHNNSSGSSIHFELPTAELNMLAKKGVIKVAKDSIGRPSYTTELRLKSKTGEYRWHLIRCVQIENIDFGTGESSWFGSATDINDHKLLEEKLKEAMDSKGRFLSNMSHEIRTPLIGISGMVSFLQDTVLNEEQQDYTNTIQASANSLLMIINDILDLSKVDAGMMKLSYEWFHTRSLMEEVNELVCTMAIAKRLELNYVVEEDVPSWVKGDKVRIRQVLINVIGNAIKFTSQGEVFSRCKVVVDPRLGEEDERLGEHEIFLEFSVIDTGRGFSEKEADLIFKPFSQIDGSSTRQHGGSGLGLVISRQLVELHGGKMEGTAVPGKGSTFTFSARFGLPTPDEHPDATVTPPLSSSTTSSSSNSGATMMPVKPFMLQKAVDPPFTSSPNSDASVVSPITLASSGSSDPSVRSAHTQVTSRSSVSSVNIGLTRFSEAAKASGQDLSQMKLEMPSGKITPSPRNTPTPDNPDFASQFRPPMYSILIISPQKYSREATTKHIEMTLPKDVPCQITSMASAGEAQNMISGNDAVTFTHIVLNLASVEEIISVVKQIASSSSGGKTSVLILVDSVQRQAVLKCVSESDNPPLLEQNRVIFIYKPVKPSRFAAVFDPAKLRDLSVDRNRSTAAQMVESQKQSYIDIGKRIGNKGYKVLLVEDNPVNQKVLIRYLKKVGVVADIAADGVECTDAVFSHPPGYYSLILCDLHMPRKDGYQACRDIRQWEKKGDYPILPIIALSANVMSDVQEKCFEAGFSDYITKPVDFIDLSTAMSKFF